MFTFNTCKINEHSLRNIIYSNNGVMLENHKFPHLLYIEHVNNKIFVERYDKNENCVSEDEYTSFRNGNDQHPDLENYCEDWVEMINDPETTIYFI